MISVYTCVHGVMIRSPSYLDRRGTETRKHLPCQRYLLTPVPKGSTGAGEHISQHSGHGFLYDLTHSQEELHMPC